AQAMAGTATELLPAWLETAAAVLLAVLMARVLLIKGINLPWGRLLLLFQPRRPSPAENTTATVGHPAGST
ncbi:MAG: hypothetical protein V2B18_08335, partial [Pseudomonadota bacterium]